MVGMCSFIKFLWINQSKAEENGRASDHNLAYKGIWSQAYLRRALVNLSKYSFQPTHLLFAQYETFWDQRRGYHLFSQKICETFSIECQNCSWYWTIFKDTGG